MKYAVIIFLLTSPLFSFCQSTTEEFDSKKWEPPYNLDFPLGTTARQRHRPQSADAGGVPRCVADCAVGESGVGHG